MRGAAVAEPLEQEMGIPVYDSVSLAVRNSLRLAGAEHAPIRGWGSVFAEPWPGAAADASAAADGRHQAQRAGGMQ
jgi:maleate isomerase